MCEGEKNKQMLSQILSQQLQQKIYLKSEQLGYYSYQQSAIDQIFQDFQVFRDNSRQNLFSNRSKSIEKYSFSPQINQMSQQIAAKLYQLKQSQRKEVSQSFSHNEILFQQKNEIQEQIKINELKRQDNVRCTFTPKINKDYQKNIQKMDDLKSFAGNSQQHKSIQLYEKSKSQSIIKQLKIQDAEIQKEKDQMVECYFSPRIPRNNSLSSRGSNQSLEGSSKIKIKGVKNTIQRMKIAQMEKERFQRDYEKGFTNSRSNLQSKKNNNKQNNSLKTFFSKQKTSKNFNESVLVLDVIISPNFKESITVYKDDTADKLAKEVQLKHNQNKANQLAVIIQNKLDSILGEIKEETSSLSQF